MSDKKPKHRFWNNWTEVKEATMTPEKLREHLYNEVKDKITKQLEAKYQQLYDTQINKDIVKIREELTESLTKSITKSVKENMKKENEAKPVVERDYKYSTIIHLVNGKELLIRYNYGDCVDDSRFRYFAGNDAHSPHVATIPLSSILYMGREDTKELITTPVKKTATSRKKNEQTKVL